MITHYENKMIASPSTKQPLFSGVEVPCIGLPEGEKPQHVTVLDGILGGCGLGPQGDPNTFLPEVWRAILDQTGASRVLDIGCGFGYAVRWFSGQGCEALGLEGSAGVVQMAITPTVKLHDFADGKPDGLGEFDLCWCSEFLEHVAAEHEPCYFAAIVKCRYAAISAALPGFGGHHHVNEQPSEYWIERFEAHGFLYDAETTERLRAIAIESNPTSYFPRNGLFFERVKHVEPAPLWTDIPGGLTTAQADVLAQIVKDKRVLDLRAGAGRATASMARTAKQVTAVTNAIDPFQGAIESLGLLTRVEPSAGTSCEHREALAARRFHVVYVDGSGDADEAEHHAMLALECLLPGGAVIWRGIDRPHVREGIERTGIPFDGIQDVAGMGVLQTGKAQVVVCLPHSRGVEPKAMKAAFRACAGEFADQVAFLDMSYGCLEHNFNVMLATALALRERGKATHMAMIHSDVWADPGWADILAREMCQTRAAAISAVVAIKDPNDDRTSTAIGKLDDPWSLSRFIRLREQDAMPQTFTSADVCGEGELLLINTGCMLIDLSHEFWASCDSKGTPYAFHVESRIHIEEDGSLCPQFRPEDWNLSRDLHAAGLPYAATWKVVTHHVGVDEWESRPGLTRLSNG